jgi:hypothetical protein
MELRRLEKDERGTAPFDGEYVVAVGDILCSYTANERVAVFQTRAEAMAEYDRVLEYAIPFTFPGDGRRNPDDIPRKPRRTFKG